MRFATIVKGLADDIDGAGKAARTIGPKPTDLLQ